MKRSISAASLKPNSRDKRVKPPQVLVEHLSTEDGSNLLNTRPTSRLSLTKGFDSAEPEDSLSDILSLLLSPPGKQILTYLSLSDLSNLGLTSKSAMKAILQWCSTDEARLNLFYCLVSTSPQGSILGMTPAFTLKGDDTERYMDPATCRSNFLELGMLLKRLTCLMDTEDRLRISDTVIKQAISVKISGKFNDSLSYCTGLKHMAQHGTKAPLHLATSIFKFVGDLNNSYRYTFCAGWSRKEHFMALQREFSQDWSLKKAIGKFTSKAYKFGVDTNMEFKLRLRMRYMFWDEVPEAKRSFWLNLMLDFFCNNDIVSRARLLFLVLGPQRTIQFGTVPVSWIMWDTLNESLDACKKETEEYFKPLGQSLTWIKQQENLDSFTRLLDELFWHDNEDRVWDAQNIAAVFLFSSEDVQLHYFKAKLKQTSKIEMTPCISEILANMVILKGLLERKDSNVFSVAQCLFACIDESKKLATMNAFYSTVMDLWWQYVHEEVPCGLGDKQKVADVVFDLGKHLMNLSLTGKPGSQKTQRTEE